MNFRFTVDVTVERSQGKFATRDEIAAAIQEALEQADPGDIEGENEGQYTTSDWSVTDVSEELKVKGRKTTKQKLADVVAKEGTRDASKPSGPATTPDRS